VKPTRHVDAERLVRTYMAQNSKDERWALLLGRLGALSRIKDLEIEGYTKAAEISEYRLSVVQALFDALRQAKPPRPDAIVEIARTKLASRRLDQSPTVLAALGWAFTEMKDRDKAFEAYDAALSSVGGDFSYHALILMEMCDYYGVDAIYQRAKAQAAEQPENIVDQAKDDRDRVFARMALAAFLQKDKKYADAKLQYEEILKIDPNDIVALNNLACLLVDDMNKPEEGMPYAERAARAAPRDSNILDTMGWALAETKQLGKATTYLLRALEVNSDNAAALYHLGMVHLKKGEKPEAELRFVKARDVETRRLEVMRKVINDTVAQLTKEGVAKARVLREADSEILPKIETELGKLK
jgi:tetratricopeptide (TPR) repeat protein